MRRESGKMRQWSISLNSSSYKRLAKTWLSAAMDIHTKTWANKDLYLPFQFDFFISSSLLSFSNLANFICLFTSGWNIIIGLEYLLSNAYTVTSTTYKVPNFSTPPSLASLQSPKTIRIRTLYILFVWKISKYSANLVDMPSTLSHSPLLSNTDGCSICSMRLYLWSMVTNWKLYLSMYTKPHKLYIFNAAHRIRFSCVVMVFEEKLVEKLAV